jgi:pimeloyl-ACP methyl ester carboxylesterase
MAHDAATFRELHERLRCKQIWVAGAAAIAAATDAHGEGGSKMRGAGMAAALAASDAELFGSPAWTTETPAAFRAMFAQRLEGHADDRLADGAGWVTFDVASIRCPVTVVHGRSDRMVDVIHARHTAELIPGANLVIFDDLGHFGIATKVVPAIRALPQR